MRNEIQFTLPDEEVDQWIELTFTIRYAVHKHQEHGSTFIEVEILDQQLASAVAYLDGHGAAVNVGDPAFCAEAVRRLIAWMSTPAQLADIEERCIEDANEQWKAAQEEAAEAKFQARRDRLAG
jgi:hypothetical protein